MKSDELKTVCYIEAYSTMPAYCAKAVDEAIDELKEALKIKDELLIENGAEIGRLKADNEKLRAENVRLKSYIKCVITRGHITENVAVETGRQLLEEYK